jgi:hypothetical protein
LENVLFSGLGIGTSLAILMIRNTAVDKERGIVGSNTFEEDKLLARRIQTTKNIIAPSKFDKSN